MLVGQFKAISQCKWRNLEGKFEKIIQSSPFSITLVSVHICLCTRWGSAWPAPPPTSTASRNSQVFLGIIIIVSSSFEIADCSGTEQSNVKMCVSGDATNRELVARYCGTDYDREVNDGLTISLFEKKTFTQNTACLVLQLEA